MTEKQLITRIQSLTDDIEFSYKGFDGAICPFSVNDISLSYGNFEKKYSSIQDLLTDPVIGGKSLREIVESIRF